MHLRQTPYTDIISTLRDLFARRQASQWAAWGTPYTGPVYETPQSLIDLARAAQQPWWGSALTLPQRLGWTAGLTADEIAWIAANNDAVNAYLVSQGWDYEEAAAQLAGMSYDDIVSVAETETGIPSGGVVGIVPPTGVPPAGGEVTAGGITAGIPPILAGAGPLDLPLWFWGLSAVGLVWQLSRHRRHAS